MSTQAYGCADLVDDVERVLAQAYPPEHRLSVAELAAFDQFHTRGLAATADLATTAEVSCETRVLDVGSGLGGPARFLAATYGCPVIGVDASAPFVETARMLTARSVVAHDVTFACAGALALPFSDASFDLAWMQHVAMNIADRAGLYSEVFRVVCPGGKFAMYDVVRGSGDIVYPVPWALDPSASFLLTEHETRDALAAANFADSVWRDETDLARAWFATLPVSASPGPLNLGLAMGPAFAPAVANLGRNLASGALRVVAAVVMRP
jgi:sarcosine/dimethylglycine N-methyltransferase